MRWRGRGVERGRALFSDLTHQLILMLLNGRRVLVAEVTKGRARLVRAVRSKSPPKIMEVLMAEAVKGEEAGHVQQEALEAARVVSVEHLERELGDLSFVGHELGGGAIEEGEQLTVHLDAIGVLFEVPRAHRLVHHVIADVEQAADGAKECAGGEIEWRPCVRRYVEQVQELLLGHPKARRLDERKTACVTGASGVSRSDFRNCPRVWGGRSRGGQAGVAKKG